MFGSDVGAGFESVEQALCILDRDGSAEILVGGDSRAKHQVIPKLLHEKTGKRCVNVGESLNFGGDLATLVNVLRKHPQVLASHPLLILSVSMDEVNDISFANTPFAALANFTIVDHVRLMLRKPTSYPAFLAREFFPAVKRELRHRWKKDSFVCDEAIYRPPELVDNLGFSPLPGATLSSDRSKRQDAPAGNYLIHGARWRIFREDLQWLQSSGASSIILYDAPMDPSWLAASQGRTVLEMEKRFSESVEAEVSRFSKLRYIDFTNHPDAKWTHADFHDGNHLNPEGAIKFTEMLVDSLSTR